MKKELLNKIDLSSNQFNNFIDTVVKEKWLEICYSNDLSGWTNDLIFDGEYKLTGAMSQGSYLSGEYIFLDSITYGSEPLPEVVTFDNVESLPDLETFKEFVLQQEYEEEELIFLTEEDKNTKFYDLIFCDIDGYYLDFNYKNYQNLLRDCTEYIWEFEKEQIINRIENNVEMCRNYEEE